MKLTLQTDYALRALIYLGVRTEGLCSIRQIAQAYGVSEGHMIKVIHRLGMGGFIETVRGRNGGVRLGRAPETILIGAVVRYMEEDLSLLACMEPGSASKADLCALMPGCRLRGVLSQAMGAMLGVLDQYTLADVITPHERRRLTEEAG
ncbi:Rrf2 family transcriptional regulator [Acetobacter peroxydans]|jgi:Rrf2 family nitric oxide-sensitive transcriptional repressor|uniref:Rrf2 family transcriptional regulator n=1 Tax=Acetobacter peroxydans TaxID=104098 RepID=UPI002354453B|nr:Rrf2 family transcriptional regulator [Acetobacter peroxydans]MCH4143676.1 Rrf2 family transcriptional regulator [Acetobacter peroxydans]MCI1395081.1 Rrf2 family transcriptional regulator [Acetobacter peroxydans]MCI1412069.1 Rrf2 family transcriptional regulator [Acetobacter peroxydans]MCI1439188.1 Rrf2 family transcriptional regulator [Acetobacter peroxydans]MCI1567664.1 Rrf2 family transcriptional regulator [Acetobacter peroxydans]